MSEILTAADLEKRGQARFDAFWLDRSTQLIGSKIDSATAQRIGATDPKALRNPPSGE